MEKQAKQGETKESKKNDELQNRENDLARRESRIADKSRQLNEKINEYQEHYKILNQRDVEVTKKELEAKNGFQKQFEETFSSVKESLELREKACTLECAKIESEKANLLIRENAVKQAELSKKEGFVDLKKEQDDRLLELYNSELLKIQEMNNKASEEIRKASEKEFEALKQKIQSERENQLSLLQKELDAKRKDFDDDIHAERESLKFQSDELKKREERVEDLELEKDKTRRERDRIAEERDLIPEKIEQGIVELKKSLEMKNSQKDVEIDRLRAEIKSSNEMIDIFKTLQQKLGGKEPEALLLELKSYEIINKQLKEDLCTRPTYIMQAEIEKLVNESKIIKQRYELIEEENIKLRDASREQGAIEQEKIELESKIRTYKTSYESVSADNERLSQELKRLQASYERKADRDARIADIESPYLKNIPTERSSDDSEIEWLSFIGKKCEDYGLKFPKRILYAFHTALKTAEWSPITVLAGVSGTGKSELPRLYSHFGGLNFLSLSVQPNWDSQESMLGFFNSIDNRFDAQPVLRLLAQSQKTKNAEYLEGLNDVMTIILMDEMNLAHVELYFSDFLSKLELRRGTKTNNIPKLDVKLGSGILPYELSLGRNVLWAGTMNQDETTKSLSDKVLDRGILINFPRPTKLERRKELKTLEEQQTLLPRKTWESWWCKESNFAENEIKPYKDCIEKINEYLSEVGRALGHRVWQSIEYYMCNYPDVLLAQSLNDESALNKAMHISFEDQLVQKVMPKLRGIETRGTAKANCLDKIRNLLDTENYAIVKDFDVACNLGYGQFMWNSANYLNDDVEEIEEQ